MLCYVAVLCYVAMWCFELYLFLAQKRAFKPANLGSFSHFLRKKKLDISKYIELGKAQLKIVKRFWIFGISFYSFDKPLLKLPLNLGILMLEYLRVPSNVLGSWGLLIAYSFQIVELLWRNSVFFVPHGATTLMAWRCAWCQKYKV